MNRLLIIDDEEKTANFLKKGLEEESYFVDIAMDGQSALNLATEQLYSLLILDMMLPVMDGWQFLSRFRDIDQKTPVILLTSLNSVYDRVRGLQSGADDYLCKPFAFSELSARVEAVLRRATPSPVQESFEIEDLKISLTTQTVEREGKSIELTSKEFRILCLLCENHGRMLSRRELSEKVWGIDFDCETNVVDVAIRRLRQKIDAPFNVKLIHTIRGIGYVLEKR